MTEKSEIEIEIEKIFINLSHLIDDGHHDKLFSNTVGFLILLLTKFDDEKKRGMAIEFVVMQLSRVVECNFNFDDHRRKTVENTLAMLRSYADTKFSSGPH